MSKYTTNFKTLIDMKIFTKEDLKSWFTDYDLTDYLTQEEIDTILITGVWDPVRLADKIIDHYYFRDFGFETPAMFKHYAKITMREIMESKLPLIYSAAVKYDILVNVDYHETLTRENRVNTTEQASADGLTVYSDTPQGQISKSEILSGKFASNVSANEGDTNSTSNSNQNETYDKHVKGNSGVSATAQAMVKQFRENIRAIDYEIIKELNELFMGLF